MEALLPTAPERHRTDRYLLSIQGINRSAIRAVKLPTIDLSNKLSLVVTLANQVGDGQTARLMSWVKKQEIKRGELELFDGNGDVAERWSFDAHIQQVELGRLDSTLAEPLETYVFFLLSDLEITTLKK